MTYVQLKIREVVGVSEEESNRISRIARSLFEDGDKWPDIYNKITKFAWETPLERDFAMMMLGIAMVEQKYKSLIKPITEVRP